MFLALCGCQRDVIWCDDDLHRTSGLVRRSHSLWLLVLTYYYYLRAQANRSLIVTAGMSWLATPTVMCKSPGSNGSKALLPSSAWPSDQVRKCCRQAARIMCYPPLLSEVVLAPAFLASSMIFWLVPLSLISTALLANRAAGSACCGCSHDRTSALRSCALSN